ncbi:hypothetical protein JCM3770_005084 [Rhodotorula araucariae]
MSIPSPVHLLINREVVSPDDAQFGTPPGHKSRTFIFPGQLTGERAPSGSSSSRIAASSTSRGSNLSCPSRSLQAKTFQKGYHPHASLTVACVAGVPSFIDLRAGLTSRAARRAAPRSPAGKTEVPCVPWRQYDRSDAWDAPLATFAFQYETRAQLQAIGLLPGSSSSSSSAPAPAPAAAAAPNSFAAQQADDRRVQLARIRAEVADLVERERELELDLEWGAPAPAAPAAAVASGSSHFRIDHESTGQGARGSGAAADEMQEEDEGNAPGT